MISLFYLTVHFFVYL